MTIGSGAEEFELPPPAPDRSFDRREVGAFDRVIEGSTPTVLDCVRSARAGAELPGGVRLHIRVETDGSVTAVRVTAPRWLIQHGFADCAVTAARAWRFPASRSPSVWTVPVRIGDDGGGPG